MTRGGMTLFKALLGVGCVFCLISLSNCSLLQSRQLDERLNPWLGKSKEDLIKSVGAPTKCTALKTGEEVCEWVQGGVSRAEMDCPPDLTYGGHRCRSNGGESWGHHTIFTYDASGLATEWSYWGSAGRRSSKDSSADLR